MNKEKGKGGQPQAVKDAARRRSNSTSGVRSRTASTSDRTQTTKDLMEETSRLNKVAAAATHKAQQRKMTEFLGQPSGGAGELPSGPCGLAANPGAGASGEDGGTAPRSLTEEVASVVSHLRTLQEQQQEQDNTAVRTLSLVAAGKTGEAARAAGGGSGAKEQEEEGGWQVWTNRKNRRIGEVTSPEQERTRREQTPFQLPGQPQRQDRGYYTSAYKRNQAAADQYRSNQSSVVAALTERQWYWFQKKRCLNCGRKHQVKDCPHLTCKEEGYALLRAALDCPPDMRPRATRGSAPGSGAAPPMSLGTGGARRGAGPATGTPKPPPPAGPPAAGQAQKRTRDSGPGASTGLTPEAKRAKQFSDAHKASLTLHVREKDGTALTEDRYLSLKSSFAYYVEDMLSKDKDPPLCSGRWTFSRSVVKIPMGSDTDMLWMRCFLDKAYLVQSDEEYSRSKGNVYVAYLRDRLEPELTGMRPDKLSSFVKFFKRRMKIDGLFDLKMAVKTPKGKAIHLVMDDKAEEIFIRESCLIPMAGAGWVQFEDRATYVARIKAQERQRLQPKPSELQKGLLVQELGMEKMVVDDDEDVIEIGRAGPKGEPEKHPERDNNRTATEHEKTVAKELQQEIRQGKLEKTAARAKFLEETGLELDDVIPRRTISGSSWHEEVELAKNLEVPEQVEEEAVSRPQEEDDQANFELQQEQQVHHRAAGSAGVEASEAAGPSNK